MRLSVFMLCDIAESMGFLGFPGESNKNSCSEFPSCICGANKVHLMKKFVVLSRKDSKANFFPCGLCLKLYKLVGSEHFSYL